MPKNGGEDTCGVATKSWFLGGILGNCEKTTVFMDTLGICIDRYKVGVLISLLRYYFIRYPIFIVFTVFSVQKFL